MAPNYRSLVPGGFFSSTPMDKSTGPVTIRMNNPGAINGASWETTYPGFVSTVETTPGNKSTIFEAPEYGVGAWWNLLRIYRTANTTTVGGIINRYGGGQDYSAYIQFVVKATGFTPDIVIDLNNDQQVLAFGRAMFRYEAGRALPWSDDQILYGIRGGRALASTGQWPASPPVGPAVTPAAPAAAPVAAAPAATGQLTDNDLLPDAAEIAGRAGGFGGSSGSPRQIPRPHRPQATQLRALRRPPPTRRRRSCRPST